MTAVDLAEDHPGMVLLAAIATGTPLDVSTGTLCVLVPGVEPQPVPEAVLADLEGRGYLDLSGPAPAVTERGHYWCRRWATKWARAMRRR